MSNARLGDLERRLCNIVHPGTIDEVDHEKARVRVKVGKNQTAWIPWVTGRAGGDRTWSAPEKGEQVLVLSPSGDLRQGYVLPSIYRKDYPANGDSGDVSRVTYKDGAVIEYDRENHAHAATIPSGGKATVKVGDNASTEITTDTITHKMGSDASAVIKGDSVKLNLGGIFVELTSSGVKIKGNLTVDGAISQSGGNISSTGNWNLTGSFTATQDIKSTAGDVKAQTISLRSHVHSGVQSGGSTTAVPVP